MVGVLVLGLFVNLAYGYDDFSNPPPSGPNLDFSSNVLWQIGSTQLIQWNTGLVNYTVRLWQQDLVHTAAYPGRIIFTRALTDPYSNQFNWTVSTDAFSLSYSNVYFLGVDFDSPNQNAESFISHYFNLTTAPVASTSVSSPVSISSTSIRTVTASATPQGSPKPKGSKAGLGVGLGIGLSVIVMVIAFVALKLFNASKNQQSLQQPEPPPIPPKYGLSEAEKTPSYTTDQRLSTRWEVGPSPPAEMPVTRF